ncbi:MAG: hypothetical protein ACFFD2_20655, partial [Promethearchaeota archaeon]
RFKSQIIRKGSRLDRVPQKGLNNRYLTIFYTNYATKSTRGTSLSTCRPGRILRTALCDFSYQSYKI